MFPAVWDIVPNGRRVILTHLPRSALQADPSRLLYHIAASANSLGEVGDPAAKKTSAEIFSKKVLTIPGKAFIYIEYREQIAGTRHGFKTTIVKENDFYGIR